MPPGVFEVFERFKQGVVAGAFQLLVGGKRCIHGVEEHLPAAFVIRSHQTGPGAVGVVGQEIAAVAPAGQQVAGVALEIVGFLGVDAPAAGVSDPLADEEIRL